MLEKIADVVTINVEHIFTEEEQKENANNLNRFVQDKYAEENKKKVVMADFKSRIDQMDGQVRLYSGYLSNGFTYKDKTCELYLDFATQKRMYIEKATGELLREEDFHAADFQKKIKFEEEESDRKMQIAENNIAGDIAEGVIENDPIDKVISDRKLGVVHFDEKEVTLSPEEIAAAEAGPATADDLGTDDKDLFGPADEEDNLPA